MASQQPFSEDAVAAADKEMEERANRAKELLSKRYHGLKNHQVSIAVPYCAVISVLHTGQVSHTVGTLSFLLTARKTPTQNASRTQDGGFA